MIAVVTIAFSLLATVTLSDKLIGGKTLHRERRALVFDAGAVLQLTIGLTTPVDVPYRKLPISYGLQRVYRLPTNATQWHTAPDITQRREISSRTLRNIYAPLESFLEEHGFNGRMCILRGICEAARAPFYQEKLNFLEEVIHAILTS